MFQNYLVTALRNIVHHKLYSFINIAGLAVGLVCAILITLFLRLSATNRARCGVIFSSDGMTQENGYRAEEPEGCLPRKSFPPRVFSLSSPVY